MYKAFPHWAVGYDTPDARWRLREGTEQQKRPRGWLLGQLQWNIM